VGFKFFPSFVALVHKNLSYIECTKYSRYILLNYVQVLYCQKHNSTMVSDASSGTHAPKMNKSFIHMAHVSSDRACAQDGYLNVPIQPLLMEIEVGQWFVFGWFWSWGTSDAQLARWKLGINTHPNHGGCHCLMVAMVPSPWHCCIQQLANMLRDKSMSLKLENIIVFTMYLLAILRRDASSTHRA
jgi:hypothetical protein